MTTVTRLRQVALAARTLAPVSDRLQQDLRLPEPFHDEGVGRFGLENSVFTVGDTFLEVVAPVQDDTAAGRYLAKRGGDSGYMAIFQVADLDAARRRIEDLGIRVVWEVSLPDIADVHLHPKDVPGAIVSVDAADPPGSWRWGGPAWSGTVPAHAPGGIRGATVRARDPHAVARRWADLLGVAADHRNAGHLIPLDGGRQLLQFVRAESDSDEGISDVVLGLPGTEPRDVRIGGVTFHIETAEA